MTIGLHEQLQLVLQVTLQRVLQTALQESLRGVLHRGLFLGDVPSTTPGEGMHLSTCLLYTSDAADE